MKNIQLLSSVFRRKNITRRLFNKSVLGAAVGTMAVPALLRGQDLNNKLNIAIIGAGGRGAGNTGAVASENIVVLCDVNENNLDRAAQAYPKARKEIDFRRVFDHHKEFDAVVVSTCEHTHAMATMAALKYKKHVYCEKPLTHDVWEARQIRLAAAEASTATQMGIQIHAGDNYRRVVELIQSGVIGPITEAHVWVSRAWGLQSEEAAKRNRDIVYATERPKEEMPIPADLHWDLWIGPAPYRPFHQVYFPGPKWYRWWDFGNGTMSDLGSHWNDLPIWALKLKFPLTVEAAGPPPHPEITPASMQVTYSFGKRGDMPPVQLTWYQGENKPEIWKEGHIPKWDSGVLFVGEKGMLLSDYSKHVLLPEKEFADVTLPEPFLPRVKSHHDEWLEACKSGVTPSANFDYSGWMTELNHLGNVAYRIGKKIDWDPVALCAKNTPEANKFIRCNYREGWTLL